MRIELTVTDIALVASVEGVARRLPSHASIDALLTADDPLATAFEWFEAGHPSPDVDESSVRAPIGNQEVWAAGVTYLRSRVARVAESRQSGGDTFYDLVYDADRPELFLKATPHRVVGHLGGVRIRRDSTWNVPEPELTLVISRAGKIVGYTIGNDMSSRSIEGENPLYLPQAKMYSASASLGPRLVLTDEALPDSTAIELDIARRGASVFQGDSSVGRIKRPFTELVEYLFRDNDFPVGVFLMTGTGVVPDDDFTLHPGDVVTISIDGIGTLRNTVVVGD